MRRYKYYARRTSRASRAFARFPTKTWAINCLSRNDQDYEAKLKNSFEFPACHLRKKHDEICVLVFAILHVARASLGNQPISGLELKPHGITKCTSLINFARRWNIRTKPENKLLWSDSAWCTAESYFPGMALNLGHNCNEHYVNDVSCSFLFVCLSWVWGMIQKNAKAKLLQLNLQTNVRDWANDQMQSVYRDMGGFVDKLLSLF